MSSSPTFIGKAREQIAGLSILESRNGIRVGSLRLWLNVPTQVEGRDGPQRGIAPTTGGGIASHPKPIIEMVELRSSANPVRH